MYELGRGEVIEHGTSPAGRWLRAYRLRIALAIAFVEGLLVALDVISWWLAVAVAGVAIAFYLWLGRRLGSDSVKQASWIAAASQVFVALVPLLVVLVGGLALIAVAILALVALVVLFSDRR